MFRLFIKFFARVTWKLKSIYLSFIGMFIVGAFAISYTEKLSYGDALYFTLVTGLTVGYGDISPQTIVGRVIAIVLALVGMMLTGLLVATTVQTVKYSFEKHEADLKNNPVNRP